jgi:ATP-dependent DNA helicase RecQ
MIEQKSLHTILKKSFWLQSFREGQEEIIQSVIDENDTMVYMPTGWGKSLVYQLPTLMKSGITIVISPLISLMKDQVDKLTYLGIHAALINSTLSQLEIENILQEVQFANTSRNPLKFVYIAPERLGSTVFKRAFSDTRIALVAIDEAHCISQWGHDFRPSYMKIRDFIEMLHQGKTRNFPIVALTATATPRVREDIRERLGLTVYKEFVRGFDRKNIVIVVREISAKEEKQKKVLEILGKTPGTGIIYCSSRKNVIELTEYLQSKWLKVGSYKGDMNPELREREQNAFMSGQYKAIVATNAFGMGIDKADIRFVIHYNLPGSIENYYQEVGRAGRDGKKSFWVVLASYGDTKIQEFFIDNTYPSKEEILTVYDTLYHGIPLWSGQWTSIQKTYLSLAKESGLDSDMKMGSALKILEKYNILKRGIDEDEMESDFRGRGLTLLQEKRIHSHILVDWKRQESLKDEAYFKLEQIKKLLFYPSCRKRFILSYFWDSEDLEKLGENCGMCDFCLEKQHIKIENVEKIIPVSSYEIVLETVKHYDEKFGITLLAKVLSGSSEKKITEWKLDLYEYYAVFGEYELDSIVALFQALIEFGLLVKTGGKYPLVTLSGAGQTALRREKYLVELLPELNTYVVQQVGTQIFKKWNSPKKSGSVWKTHSGQTYTETLLLLQKWLSVQEVAGERKLSPQTVESHIIELYRRGEYALMYILNLTDLEKLKRVKSVFRSLIVAETGWLKALKEKLEADGRKDISYFDIKLALAMMEKGDL